jgi:Concanavalin A-like lectin/glucanases superfamily
MKKISNGLYHSLILIACIIITFISCNKPFTSVPSPQLPTSLTASDSVAAANLIAYWPFEDNVNDVVGNQTGTAVNVGYITGVKGKAYQGGDSAYATVAANPAFSNLSSFSFSIWYKLAAQQPIYDPGGMFFLAGNSNLSELIYEVEPYSPQSGDSVKVHHGLTDLASPAYQTFVMEAFDTMAIGKWVHLVTTYDGISSAYTIYQNGVSILNSSPFGLHINPTQMWTDDTKTNPLGNLGFTGDAPAKVFIGTWPPTLFGVSASLGSNGCFRGAMDEIRVYNKALTQEEVTELYVDGMAGK